MTDIIYESQYAEEIIVEKATAALNDGGIIVIPTDTIPGIGCRADKHKAIQRLYELKDRPLDLPIPVIIADKNDIHKYTRNIHPLFEKLADRYWPGQLTIILQSNGKIDNAVGGGGNTIGFRIPDYQLVRSIVRATGFPLALTSANPHAAVPTAVHEKLMMWWKDEVAMIVLGPTIKANPPSTVVDLTTEKPVIVREGLIDTEELRQILTCG